MKKTRFLWYLIGIGALFIILMIILSSILDVGSKVMSFNTILGYLFYIVSALLIFILIINPLRIILFSPSLKIVTVMEKDNAKVRRTYKKVAANILKNNELTEEEKVKLENFTNIEELKQAINFCYNTSIKKKINDIIYKNAKTVMISTAISQNAKLDMYTVLSVNFKMIKEIVVVSGFRPNFKNLSKLMLNVATTALITEGLENLTLDEILPNSTLASLSEIPLIKPLISSILQGATNSLLTLRIGFVTTKYLFGETGISKSRIRAESFKEALKFLPLVTKDVIAFFPSKLVKLFSRGRKDH